MLALLVLVADAGLTGFMVRAIAAGQGLTTLWTQLRRRVLTAGVGAALLAFVVDGDAWIYAALAFTASANAAYAAVVPALLAVDNQRRVLWLQAGNGTAFVLLGLAAAWLDLGPTGFLVCMGLSYALLVATCGDVLVTPGECVGARCPGPSRRPSWWPVSPTV